VNSTPLLNLDITDRCFDLEIKLNELNSLLQEKKKKKLNMKHNFKKKKNYMKKGKEFEKVETYIENIRTNKKNTTNEIDDNINSKK